MKKKKVDNAIHKIVNMLGGESIIFIALAIIGYSLSFYFSVESITKYIVILVPIGWILAIPKFPPMMDLIFLLVFQSMRTYIWMGVNQISILLLGELCYKIKTHLGLALYLLLLVFLNMKGFPWFEWFVVPKHSKSSGKK